MKRFLNKILIFSILGIFLYLLLIVFLGAYFSPNFGVKYIKGSSGHILTRLQEVKRVKNIDILFCGSSHAYRSFDTRFYESLGLTAFNLGSSAQTHIQTNVLLKRYLDQLSPKCVVYEVNPIMFSNDGVESGLDIISNDKLDFESLRMAYELKSAMVYNTLAYSFVISFFSDTISAEPNVIGNDTYIRNGFVEKKIAFYKVERKQNRIPLVFKDCQIEAFNNNIDLLRKRKIKIVLVFSPITQNLYSNMTNMRKFDQMMRQYGVYYNFNCNYIRLNDSLHFYDSGHLNQRGVEIFNYKLIETLIRDKIIDQNHRVK